MNNNNKFLKLVSSPLMNLDHTYRYSGTKLVEPESLSQHIVDTIMLGLKIIDISNHKASECVLDKSKYVMKAITHDLEEVVTGDIPRPLKYYDENTTSSLKHVADQVAYLFFKKEFFGSNYYYVTWSNAKSDKEGFILKLVDTLVVCSKVVKEVSLLHNYYMIRVAHEVSQYLIELREEFSDICPIQNEKIRDYLLSIITDAIDSMRDILEENASLLNKLDITQQSMI